MATKATIYKALLNIANMDTNYYNEHNLTLALDPLETELKLMAKITAFILNASEDLVLCKKISQDDEADLWEKDFDGSIKLWIDLGQPDEKRIKKACERSNKVIIYNYEKNVSESWFKQIQNNITKFKNLSIIHLNIEESIENFAKRSMVFQCNISDEELTLINDNEDLIITHKKWN